MLVPRLVIFFAMVGSGCPVRVRRELMEFGSPLVRIIWHAGLPLIFCVSICVLRGSCHTAALRQGNARDCQ
jgi:hypothetical protein